MRAPLAFILGALLILLPPTAAKGSVERSGGFHYVTEQYKLKPGKAKTLKASCPKKTRVLSGGAFNPHPYSSVFQYHSGPDDDNDRGGKPDDGWAAQLQAFTTKRTIQVLAVCAKIQPEYGRNRTTIAPFDSSGTGPGCDPSSLSLLGGGSSGSSQVREIESSAQDIGGPVVWLVYLRNDSGQERPVTAWSICAGLPTVVVNAAGSVPDGTQALARATCPAEAPHIVGGGFFGLEESSRIAASTAEGYNSAGPDSWTVWVDNLGSSDDPYWAQAICSSAL